MAIMIPDSCPSKASAGEKRLFRLFQDLLPDNFRAWYEPVVQGRYPDFVVLADVFGLLTLEVKGWYAAHVLKVTDNEVERQVTEGDQTRVETVPNPMRQVREYMFSLVDLLKQQPVLRHSDGDHQGKLTFPCGCGVLFSNIKRSEAEAAGWASTFPAGQVIFRDELDALESARNDRETIRRLRGMFGNDFPFDPLTEDQLKTIQGVIHKEVVVRTRAASVGSMPLGREVPEGAKVLEVLDARQEQVARSMGEGHRVFFGVAGSGKTVLMTARAKLLAETNPEKRILMLCYNRVLGTYLKDQFARVPAFVNIKVRTFHSWAGERTRIRRYPDEESSDWEARLVAGLLHQMQGAADETKYDAILIDEAHDFEPEWFSCCVQAVRNNPPGDLIIAVDGAQSLYNRPRSFTWKSVGVNAVGRSQRLGVNYRNTQEILDFAWEVAQAARPEDAETETHVRVKPEGALRHGPMPLYRECHGEAEEQGFIQSAIKALKGKGLAEQDIAILYSQAGGERIKNLVSALRQTQAVTWITDPDNRLARDRFMSLPGVRVSTIKSAKGLEFRAVIVCAVDQLPYPGGDESSDANVLYVGLTRAMDWLVVTWSGDTSFTRRIVECGKAQAISRSK